MPKPLSPPSISPIAASSEEQKEYEDNKNEVHIFLPKYRIFSPVIYGCRIIIYQPRRHHRGGGNHIPATLTGDVMSGNLSQ